MPNDLRIVCRLVHPAGRDPKLHVSSRLSFSMLRGVLQGKEEDWPLAEFNAEVKEATTVCKPDVRMTARTAAVCRRHNAEAHRTRKPNMKITSAPLVCVKKHATPTRTVGVQECAATDNVTHSLRRAAQSAASLGLEPPALLRAVPAPWDQLFGSGLLHPDFENPAPLLQPRSFTVCG